MAVKLASELQSRTLHFLASQGAGVAPYRPMTKDLQVRFIAIVLALLTLAAAVFAWINYRKEREFAVPYDGVWFVEQANTLVAARVDPVGPGAKAGIKEGDRLSAV